MRAIHVEETPGGLTLTPGSASRQQPGPSDLVVRVFAAGVTPTELLWYPTSHTKSGETRTAAIPCHEFSGVIEDVGEDVGHLEIGMEVFGMNDWFADGALADYCLTPFSSVAPKPLNLTHAEAASVPIGALTAWQGLFDRADLQPGERVLVHGGAGSVGLYAVQLAAYRGAHVIATASDRNLEFVASLGAGQVIDYQASRFEDLIASVDVVFDTVGGETLDRSWGVLKSGGRMVTIAANGEAASEERVKQAFFIVEPNQKQLSQIAALLDAGKLRAIVDASVPWSDAVGAFAGRVRRSGRGKVVVTVADWPIESTDLGQVRDRLELLAYRMWQDRGSPLGSPEVDWFRAAEKLRREEEHKPVASMAASSSE
ncbi:MAG: zinc-binding dehydrogenase [Bryobacteraceae bacterium]